MLWVTVETGRELRFDVPVVELVFFSVTVSSIKDVRALGTCDEHLSLFSDT